MQSSDRLNALYVSHVSRLEQRLKSDDALRAAVGGEFLAIGQLEHALLRSRGLKDGDLVVDVGCGSGRLACQLAPFKELRYIGCDVVPRLLEYARDLCGRPDWQFIHTAGTTIPAAEGVADFVTFFSVFTHLPQEQIFRYFREAHRVLKPGGLLVLSFLEFRVPAHWANFVASVDGTRTDDHLNQYVEREAIRVWADACGFELRSIDGGDTPHIPLRDEIVFENGARQTGAGSLGQSVAVLQKRIVRAAPPADAAQPASAAAPQATQGASRGGLSNVSTRVRLAAGGSAVLGFIVDGASPRPMLVRAVGPGLHAFGIADALAAPQLTIFTGADVAVPTTGAWRGAAALVDAMQAAGAFTLSPDSRDAVVLTSLAPGNHSAVVSDATQRGGEVLLEIYAL